MIRLLDTLGTLLPWLLLLGVLLTVAESLVRGSRR